MQRVGFFRELPHGDPLEKSLDDAEGHVQERAKVANYLESATILFASPGLTGCVVEDCGARIERHVLTDGLWAWPKDFAHYVRYHGVTVPAEMLARIEAAGYEPPSLSLAELKALEV